MGAAFADVWVGWVLADGFGIFPAAGAFFAAGLFNFDVEVVDGVALDGIVWDIRGIFDCQLADDEEIFDWHVEICQGGLDVLEAVTEVESDLGIEGVADFFVLAGGFQWLGDFGAEVHEGLPLLVEGLIHIANVVGWPAAKLDGRWLVGHIDVAEDFFGGEGQNWRENDIEPQAHVIEHSLATATGRIIGLAGIETILDDAEIHSAQIQIAEIVDGAIDDVEIVGVVIVLGFVDQLYKALHHPAVEFGEILVGDAVLLNVKIADVAEHEAEGVADLAIGIRHLLDDAIADGNVAAIVGRRYPQTQDVGTVLTDDVLWIDAIAFGLAHLVALFVNEEAVGQEALVWCLAVDSHRRAEGRVEPASMLVAAFEVEVCWPEVLRGGAEHAFVARARVKPHVHDVGFLAEMMAATFWALVAFRHEFFGALGKPAVGAVFAHVLLNAGDGGVIEDGFAAILAVENWDWHTPDALTRNAPVATVADHVIEAILAPFWRELDVVFDLVEGFFAEAVDGGKPLVSGTEQGWCAAAPAMWVLVLEEAQLEEGAGFVEVFADGLVGIVGAKAGKWPGFFGENAIIIQWRKDWQLVALPDHIVIDTMARRGMNAASTGIEGDVSAIDDEGLSVEEWMLANDVFQILAAEFLLNGVIGWQANGFDNSLHQFLGENVAVTVKIDELVGKFRIQADGFVGWQGPRGGRPNDKVGVLFVELALGVGHCKAHIDGWGFFFAVFDFGFSQGGVVVWAPVDRLGAFVDIALLGHFTKDANFSGFKFVVQGQIWMLPIAAHTQALEAVALNVDVFHGVIGAGIAEADDVVGLGIEADVFNGLELNWQPVGIPAWHVWGVIALEGLGFDDEILEHLVHGVAEMNFAVGVWRAIVEHEFFVAFIFLLHLFINVHIFPMGENPRFVLWQIATHWKIGFWQIECVAILFFVLIFRHNVTSPIK